MLDHPDAGASPDPTLPTRRARHDARAAIAVVLAVAAAVLIASLPGDDRAVNDDLVLLVHDQAGVISIVASDGSDRVELTGAAAPDRRQVQPVWSPDGSAIAWADISNADSVLHVAAADGSRDRSAPTPVAPFFLFWSPAGDRLVGMGSSGVGIDLFLADVSGDEITVRTIDSGQPYYVDWAPDGRSLVVHVGAGVLAELDPGDGSRIDVSQPGAFQAPQWLDDGRRVFARLGTPRDALVVESDDGVDPLVDYEGFITFDAAGGRIAYTATGSGAGIALLRGAPVQSVTAGAGSLVVQDLDGGARTVVGSNPLAFDWNPDGSMLRYLTVVPGDDSGRVQWNVWGTDLQMTFDPFIPTLLFARDYLPFFDQYARSQTAWSPDGDAFAFAGTAADGRRGIWVQHLDGGPPVHAGDGEMVSWRP